MSTHDSRAAQGAERLKDGYAEYFQKYDVLLTPVLPTPSFRHGQAELLIDGQAVNVMGIMSATTPLSVTGLPGVSMRFGTSQDGMPIGVQIVGSWQAEFTILHVASLLEQVSPGRDLIPRSRSRPVKSEEMSGTGVDEPFLLTCSLYSASVLSQLDPFRMAGIPRGPGISVPPCSHSATHSDGPATEKCGIHS